MPDTWQPKNPSHPLPGVARESHAEDAGALLGPLLRALAESLDVREVFARISAEARRLVPHDFLMLGIRSEDQQRMRLFALSGALPDGTTEAVISAPLRESFDHALIVFNGMSAEPGDRVVRGRLRIGAHGPSGPVELEMQPLYQQLLFVKGMHSFARAVLNLRGGGKGGLVFCSADPEAFPPAEAVHVRTIADCVALALAHQRLAEEERAAAEARAHAARLEVRVARLTEELESRGGHRVIGESGKWKAVLSQATKVAATEATVLLTGESGTGKEVVARLVHRSSPRADGPFVALNCAALPEQLLESELFGHEKGAFTGAQAGRAGRLEQAAGGVLFLDEVGEMSPAVQAKFLRVLQEREFQRLGGTRTLKADIRVIAATNRDLSAAMGRGEFREDLYYRLHVFEIALPPLRERREDILPLVESFLEELGGAMGRPAAGLSQEARERLLAYRWPGNVREVRNAIERAVILCDGGLIASEHLPIAVERTAAAAPPFSTDSFPEGGVDLDAIEKDLVQKALVRAGSNKSKAARLLRSVPVSMASARRGGAQRPGGL
jgi:transcriptional regulator with GAF, ATPase, and Fis domain